MNTQLGWQAAWRQLLAAAVVLVGMEATARVVDYLEYSVPLLHTPDYDNDLMIIGEAGERRGRPNGRFERWKLNRYGFLGPEISEQPAPGVMRVLVLGASETFGLYEAAGNEYPSRLRTELQARGAYEVVNGALPGMTVGSMRRQYVNWSSRFGSKVVLICPTALLYLNSPDEPPRLDVAAKAARVALRPVSPRPRVWLRIKENVSLPQWLVDLRDSRKVRKVRDQHGPGWVFREVPQRQLAAFVTDLESLVDEIEASGAVPLLLTHASRSVDLQVPADRRAVTRGIVHTPRATAEVIVGFAAAGNAAMREIAKRRGITLVDLEAALRDERDCFADLVHFTDCGSAEVGKLLAGPVITVAKVASRPQASSELAESDANASPWHPTGTNNDRRKN